MKKILFFTLCFILAFFSTKAEDSVQQLLSQKEYALLLKKMSQKIDKGEFNETIPLIEHILENIPTNYEYNGRFLSLIGTAEWYLGNTEKGDSLFRESIVLAELHADTITLIRSYFNLGYIYMSKGEYTKSLELLLKAEQYAENECIEQVRIKDNISYIYIVQQNLEKAKPFIEEALQIALHCNDSVTLVNTHNSIGYFYTQNKQKDLVLHHLKEAKKIAKKINYINGVAIALSNMTDFYMREKNYSKALEYCKESLQIDQQLNDIAGQAYSYAQLAKIYTEQGNYNKAIYNINEANRLANILSDQNLKVDFLKVKANAEIANKNFEDAIETLQKHYVLKDSLMGVEKTKDLNDIMEKYETDKLKQAKILAEKEHETAKKMAVKNRNLFIVSIIVGLLGLCVALFYIHQIRLKKRAELAEIQLRKTQETLRLERRLGQAELKAIRSQMNPHFLFNAFNSIQEYIILNERELASDYLGKFADLMRMFLDQSRQKTISLENEVEALKLYLELEKIRFEDALQVEFIEDENVDTSQIQIPPMLIQPFVENSLKHGLATKIGLKKIEVSFSKNQQYLTCIVKDNGVGRKQSALINKQKMKQHKSFATSATQNRIELLNIGKEHEINIKIIDLQTIDKQAIGTQVEINIPIQ